MYDQLPKIRRRRKTSDNPEQVYAARGGKMQRIDSGAVQKDILIKKKLSCDVFLSICDAWKLIGKCAEVFYC